jgi:hypothetical protein
VVALLCLAGAGCGTVITSERQVRQGDGWTMVVEEVRSYREFPRRAFIYSRCPDFWSGREGFPGAPCLPPAGYRVITVSVVVRNDLRAPRVFNFDRCDLDDGNMLFVPASVEGDNPIAAPLARAPELVPGKAVSRRLLFVYPIEGSASRLSCAPMVVAFASFPPGERYAR